MARSTEKEFLDLPDISREELIINLRELDFINNYLGGHNATIKGLEYFFKKYKTINSIIDLGCGGGDTVAAIAEWARRNRLDIKLTGIDILPEAIDFANIKYSGYKNVEFICSDFNILQSENKYDIAVNSLICHHFFDEELYNFIKCNQSISKLGFIINDLHRHKAAYYSISILTKLFSKSFMVRNDAPLSVKKGFKKSDLENILIECGINNFKISWEWAFRYLVIAEHDAN